jgi:predicted  nucleic acid-binding Zn-ribbon protein
MSQDLQQLRNEKAKLEERLQELEAKKEGLKKKLGELTVDKDKLYAIWSSTRDFQEASRIEMRFTALSRQISTTQEEQRSIEMKMAGMKSSIASLAKAIRDKEALQRSKWQVERPGDQG